ncbi:MAG: PHB depolymerase family esterase [Myxococcota bacterium]
MTRPLGVLGTCALLCALLSSPAAAETVTFAGRPSNLVVPSSYDPNTPAPLIVLLHGYGANGAGQDLYMGFSLLANEFGFLFINPDGLLDPLNNRFWSATDACCNFFANPTDDSAYVRGLIDTVRSQYNVDERRIFVTGHSNGGFMSYRMACDHAEVVAAIASFAGATYDNPASCSPSEPVNVLQIHGTADGTILYGGGSINLPYPGAVESVETWNAYNGCSNSADTSAPNLDLISNLAGAETSVARYTDGCQLGGSGELWTIQDGVHVPALTANYARSVVEYMYAHPKPAGPPAVSALPGAAGALALVGLLGATTALALARLRAPHR